MRKVILTLAFLACACNARRARVSEAPQRSIKAPNGVPSFSLAKLLLKTDPIIAFKPSGARALSTGNPILTTANSPRTHVVMDLPNFPADFCAQISREFAGAFKSPTYAFGFSGACCNWFLGGAAVYDSLKSGPEKISLPMTVVMLVYSSLFARWAGWAVGPRNYVLCASHIFNVLSQSNQLRRVVAYKLENEAGAKEELVDVGIKAAASAAVVATVVAKRAAILSMMGPNAPAFFTSPAGFFTIQPWPALTKLAISFTSLLEFDRPTDKISLPQYLALTLTGAIFSCYGLAVTPINYVLSGVNVLLFLTSAYQLARKIKADFIK